MTALRAGDEHALRTLVRRHHTAMLAVALRYVHNPDTAEEVVQETWAAMLRQLDRFEARSSLKSWLFTILVNRARSRWGRDARVIPGLDEDRLYRSVPAERFHGHFAQRPFSWAVPPVPWDSPADAAEARELDGVVRQAIARLPAGQRSVIMLRDVEGWSSEEVCARLGISAGNQRVLLHRARSRVRAVLERYFDATDG